jgi:outer membrane lipase/esterase
MRVVSFTITKLVTATTLMQKPVSVIKPVRLPAFRPNIIILVVAALLMWFNTAGVAAQGPGNAPDYTSIVVFGDSLSDTGNLAHLTEDKYGVRVPGPAVDYTDGRATDGYDTLPAAQNYFGVWIEQLAATLPSKPEIKNSLDGGTDYAYGFATTGTSTGVFTFGPSDSLSVNIDNIGLQITHYLSTHPRINNKTLFVVWGGAIDVLYATSSNDVIDAGINQILNIQRLIDAGATQFLIPNLPPLGLVPRLNGSPATSIPATQASVLYNTVLSGGLSLLQELDARRRLHIAQLDVFTLFNQIVAAPSKFSLTNINASSQGIAVDPDFYLFWDDLHPTTRGHNILATTAGAILNRGACEASTARLKTCR